MNQLKIKYKDSVFTHLFSIPKYTLQLYQSLYPEDKDVTEDDISNKTIENILTTHSYNDLSFYVKNHLFVFIEAQSTWNPNIILRLLDYISLTFKQYVTNTKQNIYSSTPVNIPDIDLYVLYTGKPREEQILSFRDIYRKKDPVIDLYVKVIYDGTNNDILHQYTSFTKIMDNQIQTSGKEKESIQMAIDYCIENNILKDYLSIHRWEVMDMMYQFYDQKYATEMTIRDAVQEGKVEGKEEEKIEIIHSMYKDGDSIEKIARITKCDISYIKEIISNQ